MKRRLFLVLLCLLLCLLALAKEGPALYPIRVDGRWGYMDRALQVRIQPQYLEAQDFRGRAAIVLKPEGLMLIDRAGRELLPRCYPNIEPADRFVPGLFQIEDAQGQRGYYDAASGFSCAPRYQTLFTLYASGLIPGGDGPLVGYIDRATGEVAIPPRYDTNDQPLFFGDDAASGDIPLPGSDSGEWGGCEIIRGDGRVIPLPPGPRISGSFQDGLAAFTDDAVLGSDGWALVGLMDAEGRVILPPRYRWLGNASEGLIPVCDEEGLWGHIDLAGREVVSPRFPGVFGDGWQSGYRFSGGLALFELMDGSAIAINREGDTLWTLPEGTFDRLGKLMPNGLIWFEQNWKQGLLNAQGEVVAPARYSLPSEGVDDQDDFAEGRQAVELDGRFGYLDDQGQPVIPFQYTDAQNFKDGLARVYKDGKLCYIDREGEVVWQEK